MQREVILLYGERDRLQERDSLRKNLAAQGYTVRVASSRAEEAKCLAPGDVTLTVELRSPDTKPAQSQLRRMVLPPGTSADEALDAISQAVTGAGR